MVYMDWGTCGVGQKASHFSIHQLSGCMLARGNNTSDSERKQFISGQIIHTHILLLLFAFTFGESKAQVRCFVPISMCLSCLAL